MHISSSLVLNSRCMIKNTLLVTFQHLALTVYTGQSHYSTIIYLHLIDTHREKALQNFTFISNIKLFRLIVTDLRTYTHTHIPYTQKFKLVPSLTLLSLSGKLAVLNLTT